MRIIIYNPNSLGGNYKYAHELHAAYNNRKEVEDCILILPANADCEAKSNIKKILLADVSKSNTKLVKKLYFFYRSLVNPFIFFFFLRKQSRAAVIFNDYDQLTSLFWAPFFRRIRKKHLFSTVLHDPDRDAYLPSKWLSQMTMKAVTSIMNIAFYHEYLPQKPYYPATLKVIKVLHGIYPPHRLDTSFFEYLTKQKGDSKLIGVLGNIRDEKNYISIFEALPELENVKMLIAGNLANSSVPLLEYKKKISDLHIADKVIWVQKFLTEEEMASAIEACDIIALYYKASFTSQSGILNILAPFKKKIIVSNVPCALREVVNRFKIGEIVGLEKKDLVSSVDKLLKARWTNDDNWSAYLAYASWDNHVDTVIKELKQLNFN